MPKIVINEVDNTLRSFDAETLENVVYIPGFSMKEGSPVHIPTLCRTVSDFVSIFGDSFLLPSNIVYSGFDEDYDGQIMYQAGIVEPSYRYAYSLLSRGIPVVYERVNETFSPSTISYQNFSYDNSLENTPNTDTSGTLGSYFVKGILTDDETSSNQYVYKIYYLSSIINSIDSQSQTSTIYNWTQLSTAVAEGLSPDQDQEANAGRPDHIIVNSVDPSILYSFLKTERFALDDTNVLLDKSLYNISFITSGGYPSFEYDNNSLVKSMNSFVSARGDCTALIDHINLSTRDLTGDNSVWKKVQDNSDSFSDKCQMYTPWTIYGGVPTIPSFNYLMALANSVQTNPNWLAVAGTVRGIIPGVTRLNIGTNVMTRAIADSYMNEGGICINPIVPYGSSFMIWGNRTMANAVADTEKALYFANMRIMVNEIKKQCYRTCEALMFEQNSDVLWVNFKSKIIPLLERMRSSYGLSDYKIIKQQSSKRSKLVATVIVYPIFAVEEFEITVSLEDDETVSVVEE